MKAFTTRILLLAVLYIAATGLAHADSSGFATHQRAVLGGGPFTSLAITQDASNTSHVLTGTRNAGGSGTDLVAPRRVAAPESGTLVLFGAGLLLIAVVLRRRFNS